MRWARKTVCFPIVAFTAFFLVVACEEPASGPRVVTLRVTSTSPGEEVSFKGAYMLDAAVGVQEVEGQTPFEARGESEEPFAWFEKVAGEAQVQAELIRVRADGHREVASASGPHIEVRLGRPQSNSSS